MTFPTRFISVYLSNEEWQSRFYLITKAYHLLPALQDVRDFRSWKSALVVDFALILHPHAPLLLFANLSAGYRLLGLKKQTQRHVHEDLCLIQIHQGHYPSNHFKGNKMGRTHIRTVINRMNAEVSICT